MLPADHDAYELISQLRTRLADASPFSGPLPRVHILGAGAPPNAFVLANGAVFASVRLLDALRTEGEVAALLTHEYTHYFRGHFRDPSALLEPALGQPRQHEYESDFIPAAAWLDRAGFNPMGMASLMERLETVVGNEWDPEHGSLHDRAANVRMLEWLPLVEFDHLEEPETPLPKGWLDGSGLSRNVRLVPSTKQRIDDTLTSPAKMAALADAVRAGPDAHTWVVLSGVLRSGYGRALEARARGRTPEMVGLSKLVGALDAHLAETTPEWTIHERSLALAGLLTGGIGVPLLQKAERSQKPNLEVLDIPIPPGDGIAGRLQGALIHKGAEAFSFVMDAGLWEKTGAEVLFPRSGAGAFVPLFHYLQQLEGFSDLDTGEPSCALTMRGIGRLIEAASTYEQKLEGQRRPDGQLELQLLRWEKPSSWPASGFNEPAANNSRTLY
ncbi:MAG: M48 family metalloprotease [Myxococcaceae bacterium]